MNLDLGSLTSYSEWPQWVTSNSGSALFLHAVAGLSLWMDRGYAHPGCVSLHFSDQRTWVWEVMEGSVKNGVRGLLLTFPCLLSPILQCTTEGMKQVMFPLWLQWPKPKAHSHCSALLKCGLPVAYSGKNQNIYLFYVYLFDQTAMKTRVIGEKAYLKMLPWVCECPGCVYVPAALQCEVAHPVSILMSDSCKAWCNPQQALCFSPGGQYKSRQSLSEKHG